MGKPYADDLRLVVVRLIEEGDTRPEVAELCGISLSSVGRYIQRYRTTGSVSSDKFGGYKHYALAKRRRTGIRRPASCLSAEPLLGHFAHGRILLDQHTIEALPPGRDPGRTSTSERIKDASAARANQ